MSIVEKVRKTKKKREKESKPWNKLKLKIDEISENCQICDKIEYLI